MPILHKQSCPTCGQSVNRREVQINAQQIRAMYQIYAECMDKGSSSFTRKEVSKYLTTETLVATFGDLKHTSLFHKPAKGKYEINVERCRLFFAGRLAIPTKILKDPLKRIATALEYSFLNEVKNIKDFLDSEGQMIVRYEENGRDTSF